MKNKFNTLSKKVNKQVMKVYNEAKNCKEKLQDSIQSPENQLKEKIKQFRQCKFKDKANDIQLIQEIINLSVKIELKDGLGQEMQDGSKELKKGINNNIKNVKSLKQCRKPVNNAIDETTSGIKKIEKKFLQWYEGDPETIYNVLQKYANRSKDHKLSEKDIKELASNSPVSNFVVWIYTYIFKNKDFEKANDVLKVGQFVKKLYLQVESDNSASKRK